MNIDRLFDQIGHDLGWRDHSMRRDRPYSGQAHTCTGTRGSTEIKGITFRDLRDCFIRAYAMSHSTYVNGSLERVQPNAALADEASKGEDAAMCESDIYTLKGDVDPMAFCQNLVCEVERVMGIFPNVQPLNFEEQPHDPR